MDLKKQYAGTGRNLPKSRGHFGAESEPVKSVKRVEPAPFHTDEGVSAVAAEMSS